MACPSPTFSLIAATVSPRSAAGVQSAFALQILKRKFRRMRGALPRVMHLGMELHRPMRRSGFAIARHRIRCLAVRSKPGGQFAASSPWDIHTGDARAGPQKGR